jgi:hypothetical protein
MSPAPLLLALVLQGAPPAPGAWIMQCDVRSPEQGAAAAVRVFRVGPSLLQEWTPEHREFGPNLCLSFQCKGDHGRLEGSIVSASLIFTLSFDPQARRADWRTVGASGLKRTSGACTAEPDKAKPGGGALSDGSPHTPVGK